MPGNPYRALSRYSSALFQGREDHIRWVFESLGQLSPLAVLGLPGMGKSALLRYLADSEGALRRYPEWLPAPYDTRPDCLFPVRVEFRLRPRDEPIFAYLHRQMRQAYKRLEKPTCSGTQATLLRESTLAQEPEGLSHDEWANSIRNGIRGLSDNGIRTVFLLDDFDMAYAELNYQETTWMRPWREHATFVLATERRLEEVNSAAMGSPFWAGMSVKRLGGLAPDESQRLLVQDIQEGGKPAAPPDEDIAQVVDMAGGHPSLLLVAGVALWEIRQRLGLGPAQPLSSEQMILLEGRLRDDFSRTFQLYWARLNRRGREALLALARSTDLVPEHQWQMAVLTELGLVKQTTVAQPKYDLFSPLFRSYLQEDKPATKTPKLTASESRLYEYLHQNRDRFCGFRELWEVTSPADRTYMPERDDKRLHTLVSRLRTKLLDSTGEDIINVRGEGYRLLTQSLRS